MKTIKELIKDLSQFPEDANCFVYEGKITGIIIEKNGEQVDLDFKTKTIILKIDEKKYTLDGLLSQITDENKHPAGFPEDGPRGREVL